MTAIDQALRYVEREYELDTSYSRIHYIRKAIYKFKLNKEQVEEVAKRYQLLMSEVMPGL